MTLNAFNGLFEKFLPALKAEEEPELEAMDSKNHYLIKTSL
jgi:hypothetical protein